jgi:hypothetical protein
MEPARRVTPARRFLERLVLFSILAFFYLAFIDDVAMPDLWWKTLLLGAGSALIAEAYDALGERMG